VEEHHITVPRSARYHLLGDPTQASAIWIVLHGYGQLARYFLRHFEGLHEGLLIAAPEGLSRYYTDDGHTRVGATWMTREDREQEIADHVNYLDLLADELLRRVGRPLPIHVLGFSQGVATAARWTTRGRTRADLLVLWGGQLPPDLQPGSMRTHWGATRICLVHGNTDELVPSAAVETAAQRMHAEGLTSTVIRYDGGHALDRLVLGRLIRAAVS
jgi:predicted esterase